MGTSITLSNIKVEGFGGTSSSLLGYDKLPNGCKTGTTCNGINYPNIQVDDITRVGQPGGKVALKRNEKYSLEFTLIYINENSQLPHTVKGAITGTVQ